MVIRRLMVRGFLLVLLIVGVALVVAFIAGRTMNPNDVDTSGVVAKDDIDLRGGRGAGGADFDVFVSPERVPTSRESEMDASVFALLPERQSEPVAPVAVADDEHAALADVAAKFLHGWETFTPGEDLARYTARFSRWTLPQSVDRLARRAESRQDPTIGMCDGCVTGSRALNKIDPRFYVVVRRIDGRSAYITTHMVVEYVGDGSPLNGRSFRRSYALLLDKDGDGWRVRRAVAETLEGVS